MSDKNKLTHEDIARIEFYIRDLKEAMEVYDVKGNTKLDIWATVGVWKIDISVAYSLIRELMEKSDE